jgi:hypothetical protein
MSLHSAQNVIRLLLPRFIHLPLRRVGVALLTPMRFARVTGHFNSSLRSAAFDHKGRHIPWYTYPAIDLLAQKNLKERTVLEFGSGHSTIWWGLNAKSVVSFEEDRAWYDRIVPLMSENVSLSVLPNLRDPDLITSKGIFDIIVIDGFWRFRATEIAISMLAANGALIIDNSECHFGPDGTFPMMDLLRREGFARVDFHGFAPGVAHRQCTSIAYRGHTFLFDGIENPARLD